MASKRSNPKGGAKNTGATEASGTSHPEKVAQIQKMIDVMKAAGVVELEMKDAETALRIRLKEDPAPLAFAPAAVPVSAPPPVVGAEDPKVATPLVDVSAAPEVEGEIFKSPMVGTFYWASSPEADPYVKEGDRVGEDSTLCVIEAMKVMNEIKADMEGVIAAVLVENNEPVDYGQPLFVIKA
jgi:acetyl-CoA carboxylase biotin carboxyl carrier protein